MKLCSFLTLLLSMQAINSMHQKKVLNIANEPLSNTNVLAICAKFSLTLEQQVIKKRCTTTGALAYFLLPNNTVIKTGSNPVKFNNACTRFIVRAQDCWLVFDIRNQDPIARISADREILAISNDFKDTTQKTDSVKFNAVINFAVKTQKGWLYFNEANQKRIEQVSLID